jgi:hypothetical protein
MLKEGFPQAKWPTCNDAAVSDLLALSLKQTRLFSCLLVLKSIVGGVAAGHNQYDELPTEVRGECLE